MVGRKWITNHEFIQDLTLSQLLPGPNMLLACTAMFLLVSILAAVIARHWETLRERRWALACERALAPIGIGLAAGLVGWLAGL